MPVRKVKTASRATHDAILTMLRQVHPNEWNLREVQFFLQKLSISASFLVFLPEICQLPRKLGIQRSN